MATASRRPLTSILENVLVRAVLEQAQEPLAQVREHRSTQSSVRNSFRQLCLASDSVLLELESAGGVRREVVRLYRELRQRIGDGWYDAEDMAEAAAEAVSANTAPALRELGQIVFYLPYDLTPNQVSLIRELARRVSWAVLLGTTGDIEADAPLIQLADRLQPLMRESQGVDADNTHHSSECRKLPLLQGEATLHVAPDAHTELRRVIREIMADAESGTPLPPMAVLYRMDPPHGPWCAMNSTWPV